MSKNFSGSILAVLFAVSFGIWNSPVNADSINDPTGGAAQRIINTLNGGGSGGLVSPPIWVTAPPGGRECCPDHNLYVYGFGSCTPPGSQSAANCLATGLVVLPMPPPVAPASPPVVAVGGGGGVSSSGGAGIVLCDVSGGCPGGMRVKLNHGICTCI